MIIALSVYLKPSIILFSGVSALVISYEELVGYATEPISASFNAPHSIDETTNGQTEIMCLIWHTCAKQNK